MFAETASPSESVKPVAIVYLNTRVFVPEPDE